MRKKALRTFEIVCATLCTLGLASGFFDIWLVTYEKSLGDVERHCVYIAVVAFFLVCLGCLSGGVAQALEHFENLDNQKQKDGKH